MKYNRKPKDIDASLPKLPISIKELLNAMIVHNKDDYEITKNIPEIKNIVDISNIIKQIMLKSKNNDILMDGINALFMNDIFEQSTLLIIDNKLTLNNAAFKQFTDDKLFYTINAAGSILFRSVNKDDTI